MVLPPNLLASLRQRFDALPAPVVIDYFHQSDSGLVAPGGGRRNPCPACGPAKAALEELAGVSAKVRLALHEFHAEPQLAERWGVERVPAVLLRRAGGFPPLRFHGLPGGHFPQILAETISAVARRPPAAAPAEVAASLDRLDARASVVVVGSMRHDAAAGAAAAAWQLALYSPKVEATVFELDTFPDLAARLGLREVPATVVDGAHGFSGVASPAELARFILAARQGNPAVAPPRTAPGSAVAIGAGPPPPGGPPRSAPAPAAAAPSIAVAEPADERVDVAIVGGGPAGLQAALTLARARRTVAVLDAPSPARNAASHGVHNFIGIEGMKPAEVARVVRGQIEAVGGVSFRAAEVANVERAGDGDFVLTTGAGERLGARHVVLAFGHRDEHPDVPGFAECWGTSIISCPYCDGFEHRDRVWGLVVPDAGASATSPLLAQHWTDGIKLFLGAGVNLPDEMAARLEAIGLAVHRGDIAAIEHEAGALTGVALAGGETVPVETLLWTPKALPSPLAARLAGSLGLALDGDGFVAVNPMQQTNVERLWAAGEAVAPTLAIDAARSGGAAAMLIVQGWFEEAAAGRASPSRALS